MFFIIIIILFFIAIVTLQQVSEVFKKLPWSHRKGISQRNLAMKV